MDRSNLVTVLLIVVCMAMSAAVHGSAYEEGRLDYRKEEESYGPYRQHQKRHLISQRCWSAVRKSHTTCFHEIRRSFIELDFIVSDECCDNAMDVEVECYHRRIHRQNLLFNFWFKQHCPSHTPAPASAPVEGGGTLPSPPAPAPADDFHLPSLPAPAPAPPPGDDDGELPSQPTPAPLPGDDDGGLPPQPAPAPFRGGDGGFESPAPTPTEDDGNDCSD